MEPSDAGGDCNSAGWAIPKAAAAGRGAAAWRQNWGSSRIVPGPRHTPWSLCCNEPEPAQTAQSRAELRVPPGQPPAEPRAPPWGLHAGPAAPRRAT